MFGYKIPANPRFQWGANQSRTYISLALGSWRLSLVPWSLFFYVLSPGFFYESAWNRETTKQKHMPKFSPSRNPTPGVMRAAVAAKPTSGVMPMTHSGIASKDLSVTRRNSAAHAKPRPNPMQIPSLDADTSDTDTNQLQYGLGTTKMLIPKS